MARRTERLSGDLDFFPIFDLLQWLEQAGKTGMLRIEGEEGERSVCLRDGRIIFASSRCRGQRFGEFLASRGSIRESDLRTALEESQREGLTFTRYLIEHDVISREALEATVFELVQNILEGLFEAHEERMQFSFVDVLPSIVSEGVIQFQSAHLIMETVRRLDERSRDHERGRRRLERVKEQLDRGEFAFPSPPEIFRRLTTAPGDSWIDDVLSDAEHAGSLERLCRGKVLAGLPGDDVRGFLARLGPTGTAAVLLALDLGTTVPMENNESRIRQVLAHCVESAFAAYALSGMCGMNPDAGFLAGLVHELGKTVILNLFEPGGISEEDLNLFMTEAHLRVGGAIVERWNLSREIQAALRYQYNFRMAGSYRRIAALVQTAHGLACDPEGGGRLRFEEEAARFLELDREEAETSSMIALENLAAIAGLGLN